MEIHGGMYSGDVGQKHNAETLWNYAFMEMYVDEIGIIVGAFLFYAMNEYTSKKEKKTYLVPSLFFLSVLSSFLSSQYSLSFSFFFHQNYLCPFLFLPFTNLSLFLFLPFTNISLFLFHIILIDIFF